MSESIVAVAGSNVIKERASQDAFDALDDSRGLPRRHRARSTPLVLERYPAQPFGLEQTVEGATRRALGALECDQDAVYGVGIENGLIVVGLTRWGRLLMALMCLTSWKAACVPSLRHRLRRWMWGLRFMDVAVVAVASPFFVKQRIAVSAAVPVPVQAAVDSLLSGQRRTAGSFLAAVYGVDGADWHSHFTQEAFSRRRLVADTLLLALSMNTA